MITESNLTNVYTAGLGKASYLFFLPTGKLAGSGVIE